MKSYGNFDLDQNSSQSETSVRFTWSTWLENHEIFIYNWQRRGFSFRMPREPILEVEQAFKSCKEGTTFKTVCRLYVFLWFEAYRLWIMIKWYCLKKFARNTTRQFNHLWKYLDYYGSNGIQNGVTRKVGIHAKPANQLPIHKLSSKGDLDVRAVDEDLFGDV